MPEPVVEFLFDYASPFSFLANALVPQELGGARVVHRPVYLRGFEGFSRGVPYTPAKLDYLFKDFRRCADHAGVAFAAPAVFPINGVYALRGALLAQREGAFEPYHAALFNAAWRDGRDVTTRDAVAALAAEIGLASVAAALDDPGIKAQLRADTEAAVARGVFGVPTFFVGEELFWGHDRLPFVARALAAAGASA